MPIGFDDNTVILLPGLVSNGFDDSTLMKVDLNGSILTFQQIIESSLSKSLQT